MGCVAGGSVVVLGVPVHLARRGHGCVCSGASFPGRLFGAQPWKTERVSLWNKEQAGLLSSKDNAPAWGKGQAGLPIVTEDSVTRIFRFRKRFQQPSHGTGGVVNFPMLEYLHAC